MREMKDSGIEWIGEIPKEWNISKIKYIADIFGRIGFRGYTLEDIADDDNGAISLSPSNIIDSKMDYSKCTYISWEKYEESPEIKIVDGDILFVKTASCGKNAIVENLPQKATINPQLIVFKNINVDSKYFFYFLQTPIINRQTELAITGGTIPTMSQEKIKNFLFLVPPVLEQKQIAEYLDSRCSEIDALISDIESQIDMMEQYKRSVITEAVTKGLNPDAEMKDSGVEWIGEIPASWNVHPVYYYFGERKNKNSLGAETNLLSLSYGKIIQKNINSNGGLLPESFNTYNIVEPGDIIIRPTDLQNDKRSLRTGLVTEHGIITSAYIDLKAIKPVNTAYYHYLLHAFDVMKVFYNMGNGVRQGLNFSEFSKLMVFEPSLNEQDAIANYLDSKCSDIDAIISDKQAQLDTLAEYKKSLIYEYVTGKKEVPTS